MKVIFEVEISGLGGRIKAAREASSMPLVKICKASGIARAHWYRIEKEEYGLPIQKLRQIEAVLGVDFGVTESTKTVPKKETVTFYVTKER